VTHLGNSTTLEFSQHASDKKAEQICFPSPHRHGKPKGKQRLELESKKGRRKNPPDPPDQDLEEDWP
jgi:hypothetical protein